MSAVDDKIISRISDLAQRCFGTAARVTDVGMLAGDASTRRYARARLDGGSAPASAVVMLLVDRGVAMTSEELAVAEETDELPYVNVHHFLFSLGLAVPELYCDASQEGMLLLEDIGDTPLWDAAQGVPDAEVRELFEQAIDQLLILQIDGMARQDGRCRAFRQVFDERLFAWEFEHFIEYGLVKRVGKVPESDLGLLRDAFGTIAAFLGRQPRVLNHRDFHAWNLYVHQGRVRVIDFQDALLAPAPYDLATLLGDRVTPLLIRPSLERNLLQTYAERWEARGGAAWDPAGLWDVYAACALQKAFKVVGRFHYLDQVKGKTGYLRYIPPTLQQIARLMALRPDLNEVRAVLARYFPELRT
jgi:aminoglycoside/choline kinase family phosphotransferase